MTKIRYNLTLRI